MSAVLHHSAAQVVSQLATRARHTDHYAERSKRDAKALKVKDSEFRHELALVTWGWAAMSHSVEL